jgi:hypothetical protein
VKAQHEEINFSTTQTFQNFQNIEADILNDSLDYGDSFVML